MKNFSCTLVLVWCGFLARISEQNVVPLEAAFQGKFFLSFSKVFWSYIPNFLNYFIELCLSLYKLENPF